MLIDLIRTDNYVSFNVQLAHIVGLHAAIYLSELLNINSKAELPKEFKETIQKIGIKL